MTRKCTHRNIEAYLVLGEVVARCERCQTPIKVSPEIAEEMAKAINISDTKKLRLKREL